MQFARLCLAHCTDRGAALSAWRYWGPSPAYALRTSAQSSLSGIPLLRTRGEKCRQTRHCQTIHVSADTGEVGGLGLLIPSFGHCKFRHESEPRDPSPPQRAERWTELDAEAEVDKPANMQTSPHRPSSAESHAQPFWIRTNLVGHCMLGCPRPVASRVVGTSAQTLKRNSTTSPSCITYSLPSMRTLPAAFAAFIEPASSRSANDTISALMKPR